MRVLINLGNDTGGDLCGDCPFLDGRKYGIVCKLFPSEHYDHTDLRVKDDGESVLACEKCIKAQDMWLRC